MIDKTAIFISIGLWGMAVLLTIPYLLNNEAEPFQSHTAQLACLYMEQGLLDEYLNSLPRSTDIFTLSGSTTLNVCGKLITDADLIAKFEVIEQIVQSNCDWSSDSKFSEYCWTVRIFD